MSTVPVTCPIQDNGTECPAPVTVVVVDDDCGQIDGYCDRHVPVGRCCTVRIFRLTT